jgi:hypothetical protein
MYLQEDRPSCKDGKETFQAVEAAPIPVAKKWRWPILFEE